MGKSPAICAGYCGKPADREVEWIYHSWQYEDGRLVAKGIDPPVRIPVCAECASEAVQGKVAFAYCSRDDHWGRLALECRGGCGQ